MTETIQASKLNLMDLKLKFGLELTEDENFFPEWQEDLPELTDLERRFMNDIKQEYRHLSQYPISQLLIAPTTAHPLSTIELRNRVSRRNPVSGHAQI